MSGSRLKRWMSGVAIFAIAWSAALGQAAAAKSVDPFTMNDPAFCTPKKPLKDFGISSLPAVTPVPETGASLGHSALLISGGGSSRVTSWPQSFGYEFWKDDPGGPPVRLNWTATAELWTVDRAGHEIREVDRGEVKLGTLDGKVQPRLHLTPPKHRRGFYRYDLQLTNEAGREIGLYGTYLKVVRPFWDVKLGLSRHVAHPGQRIRIRLENFGSEEASFGEDFVVQRLRGPRWRNVPSLTPNFWLAWEGGLGPGASGRCSMLSLPRRVRLGRYRIVKHAGQMIRPATGPVHARLRWAAARFRVVAGPPK